MRSPRIMSILLYALGAGLFGWSGLMLLSGETFATLDIAASLAGFGAFTIGLGAIAGALDRLTRAIGEAGAAAQPRRSARREEPVADIVPVFVSRGAGPAHFEPLPEPTFDAVREPKSEPVLERRPEPRPAPAALDALSADHGASEEPALTKKERRARKLAKQQAAVEPPPVVAPALGGGMSLGGVRRTSAIDAVEAELNSGADASAPAKDETADRPNDLLSASDMFERARPIMPRRAPPSLRAESAPKDERPQPPRRETAETPPNDLEPDAGAPEPAVDVDWPPQDAPAPAAAGLIEPNRDSASTPAQPPLGPAPPAAEPPARTAPPDDEPKVPEWLARARARREARAQAEAPAAEDPAPPQAPEEPGPDASAIDAPHPMQDGAAPPQAQAKEPRPQATEFDPQGEEDDGPRVMSEGEHNGVLYRFYEDGSVEAVSAYGVRRFANVDELRETVRSVRGADEPDGDAPPRHEPDPLDEALAELEREPAAAPELKVDPQDRPSPGGRW